jgi:predicted metal-dependent hydrolase
VKSLKSIRTFHSKDRFAKIDWQGIPIRVFVQTHRRSLKLSAPVGENHLELSSPKSCHRDHWHKFLSEHQDWIQKHYQPLFTSQWVRLWGQKYSWEIRSHQFTGYQRDDRRITFFIRQSISGEQGLLSSLEHSGASTSDQSLKTQDRGNALHDYAQKMILQPTELLPKQVRLCYLRELQQWLPSRVLFWLRALNVSATQIRIRFMRSLWGSCAVQRRVLTFNGYLAAYDRRFVDSVVLHECAHLVIPHHGPKFQALLKAYESHLWPTE